MTRSTAPAPLLTIESVRAEYGDVVALDDVSLQIADNEFFALLGPSGCGKTTLLRAIAGFETPTAGRILLDDTDILPLPPNLRPVNMMFQSYALFPHMSVERNVAYGLHNERLDRTAVRARVGEALEVVGLTRLAHRRPAQLSGGQRQRVALARAIVKRPRLLLLDEPLSALDRKVRAEMQRELKRLQHEVGMTFVIVTHDQEEAMSMADRIAVLNAGRIEQLDTPQELYARPTSRFVADFIGQANLLPATAGTRGVTVAGFGELPVPHEHPPGASMTLVVRPENVRIDPSYGPILDGVVAEVAFVGGSSVVELDLPAAGIVLHAAVQGTAAFRRGDGVRVGLDLPRLVAVADGRAQPAEAAASTSASSTGVSG